MTASLTPSRLWKDMTSDDRFKAALAFWQDADAVNDQVQAALLISERKKFRPKTVIALDLDRKARHLAGMGALPDAMAARILVAYHLAERRPMMASFLDKLGIAHEHGLIKSDGVTPDPAKVGPAAAELAKEFPPGDVSLYLNTLLSQDPETWAVVSDLPERQVERDASAGSSAGTS